LLQLIWMFCRNLQKLVVMKKIFILTVLITLAFNLKVRAQEVHGRDNVWFLLLNHYKINDKGSLGNELHLRLDDYFNDKQQWILRPFVNYHGSDKVIYSAGYSYIKTYPYGQYPLPDAVPEHNVWEQITVNQQLNKSSISHRYRMEHRWSGRLQLNSADGSYEVADYTFSNRFRYRLTFRKPINETWFINIFDELWVRTDKAWKSTQFDRNWIYFGIGYNVNENISFQGAYMHQYAQNTPDRYERHPTIQFTAEIRLK